ncbi:MAG: DUF4365 domain-containing protein [Gemmataceae bacterium]|nr:DUF4365 domain-containing protein [Gemmataceae bacterium]MCI0739106.1 DUF4365 domain-containing protein [Gemmataceae bacterium]
MATRDLIGKRGEAIVTARLMDFCGNPDPYFDVHPLGEKCPTFDYLVELVNSGDSVPYFLVQVKSTQQGFTLKKRRLIIQVTKDDVVRMVRCPFPTYLVGVDEPNDRAYIVSVHGNMRGAIATMPATYPLTPRNLYKLWVEVKAHWRKLEASVKRSEFLYED